MMTSAVKQKRQRGVVLTPRGLQKLEARKFELELAQNYSNPLTFEALSELTRLDPRTIARVLDCQTGVDRRSLAEFFKAFKLTLEAEDCTSPSPKAVDLEPQRTLTHKDWGDAADIPVFYARTEELAQLQQWISGQRCRLVTLLGMGGIGKTTLSTRLMRQIAPQFEFVIWRSLRNAPPLETLLLDLLQFLSQGQEATQPASADSAISRLLHYLNHHRCLLVLDNLESIFHTGDDIFCEQAGCYRDGYANYGECLEQIAKATHQSCVLLTSREQPKALKRLEGASFPVRSLQLQGLPQEAGRAILRANGALSGADADWRTVITHYAGNPLALQMVAPVIQEYLNGNLQEFADYLTHGQLVFDDICGLLERQFKRLTLLERQVMHWLAISREGITLAQLREEMLPPVALGALLEAVDSLRRRCLIEKSDQLFTLQPVVTEYVTEQLIQQVCEELSAVETPSTSASLPQPTTLLHHYPLMQATAKDYVQETQIRLLLKPVLDRLLRHFGGKQGLEQQLLQVLEALRDQPDEREHCLKKDQLLLNGFKPLDDEVDRAIALSQSPLEPSYTAGNLINLLSQLATHLNGCNFSHLYIWQACLRGATLHNTDFTHSHLAKSVFFETSTGIHAVAFSPDGTSLVVGDMNCEICLYHVASGRRLRVLQGHTNWIIGLAFSPDGNRLASSSRDRTIRLWDLHTGECLQTLQGHEAEVWSVVFHQEGKTLVSCAYDRTIKLWNLDTGECLKTLRGHQQGIRSIAVSPDYHTLASGSADHTIKLWDLSAGRCLQTLQGHTHTIQCVAYSSDSRRLASASQDHMIKLWDSSTGRCLRTLQGHSSAVTTVAFVPQHLPATLQQSTALAIKLAIAQQTTNPSRQNGKTTSASPPSILVSGSWDGVVKLWDLPTGQCVKTWQAHHSIVREIAVSPDGQTIATGSDDQTVKLWATNTGQCLRTWQGYSNRIWAIATSPDGQTIASSGDGRTIKLWSVQTGQLRTLLQGHTNAIRAIAFSPDGTLLASGSDDQTVKLWNVATGQCLQTLNGHTCWVWSLAFPPDGQTLISGSSDGTLKRWHICTRQCLSTWQEAHHEILCLDQTSQDCTAQPLLATGSTDQTIKLWHRQAGECLQTLKGSDGWVWSVAFSPDGQRLASGSFNTTIKLWDVNTARCVQTLKGHRARVRSLVFSSTPIDLPSSKGYLLASGSADQTIKLWDSQTGECLKTLQGHQQGVLCVRFIPNSDRLVSGSEDGTIKLWNLITGECEQTLMSKRPYEGMKIAGITGLTEAQKATLIALGAIDTAANPIAETHLSTA